MRKRLKRLSIVLLIVALLVPCFTEPVNVHAATNADTLAELRSELAALKSKKAAADNKKAQTKGQINTNKNNIVAAQTEIETNKQKIEQAKVDIENLKVETEKTKASIENLLRSYEISSGDKTYLEYVFGATSISDFIIRCSISEQLTSYNTDLIDTYNNQIKEAEQLQIDLAQREKDLNVQISNLESSIDTLGKNLTSLIEDALDINDDIKSTQELIDYYVKMGCGENENLNACVQIRGDTGFIKPLTKGIITSKFGYRTHPVTGKVKSFHTGIDIGGNKEGTSVYSAANGMVGKIINRASCGGNQVYIYHTINGTKYTTFYMHLLKINVKVGDAVTNQTVIGTVGGGSGTSSYERCSTGAHLHFGIATGWYGSTYSSYSTFVSHLQNPTNIIKFPSGSYFYSRY